METHLARAYEPIWPVNTLFRDYSILAGKVRVLNRKIKISITHLKVLLGFSVDKESVPCMWGIILMGKQNMSPVCEALSSFGFPPWLVPHVFSGWRYPTSTRQGCQREGWV